ncbi:MAG: hypothetical protein U0S50_17070 [Sphingopyxis sp.]|uniref:hypothetical protein n=1 Tax=Sphingopyxis sp. TaxID=1908224 RepID=UPI002ABAAE09|nr:hypothetical protein [Sphingopyxis sp.]MDZ3833507.1 hypothetical protein [Sphingopyxis sp.]
MTAFLALLLVGGAQTAGPPPPSPLPPSTLPPSPVVEASADRLKIPGGSAIELVTRDAVSSKRNVKGDLLFLSVATPVLSGDSVAIPAGATVVAELSRVDKRNTFGRSGKIDVRLLYVELPGGPARIHGSLEARGKSDAGDAAATAVAFIALPFVATGRSAEIPAGTPVVGRIDSDMWIDRR